MTIAVTKEIKEHIPLSRCAKGDLVSIRPSDTGVSRFHFIDARIEKIKPVAKGKVQLKYHNHPTISTIQKITISADTMVERTRPWVESDGDAGYYPPKLVIIDGIQYRVTTPISVTNLLASIEEQRLGEKAEDVVKTIARRIMDEVKDPVRVPELL